MSSLKDIDPILITLSRDIYPAMLAEELVSVQPMSGFHGANLYQLNTNCKEHIADPFGTIVHSFIDGYCASTGSDIIPIDEFKKLYPYFKLKGWNDEH